MSNIQALTGATPQSAPAAMLMAAGRGERMRPLTDHCPKPLLCVRGQPLLQWHLQALAAGACSQVVINTAWLGEQISQRFGTQFTPPEHPTRAPALPIRYSNEGQDFGAALETAGGIGRALPWLCRPDDPDPVFWVLAGDVFTPGFRFEADAVRRFRAGDKLAHLWLVPNPEHNPRGDFGLDADGLALNLAADDARARYTYSTIGLYRRALFEPPWCDIPAGNPHGVKAALAPLLRAAMNLGRVSAELFDGDWTDVGTPARLAQLNA